MVGDTGIEPVTSSVSGTGNASAEVRPFPSVQVRATQGWARMHTDVAGRAPVGVRVGVRGVSSYRGDRLPASSACGGSRSAQASVDDGPGRRTPASRSRQPALHGAVAVRPIVGSRENRAPLSARAVRLSAQRKAHGGGHRHPLVLGRRVVEVQLPGLGQRPLGRPVARDDDGAGIVKARAWPGGGSPKEC
jgi:hypothetical protein